MIRPKFIVSSHPVVVLLLGLLISQAIATIQVYLSNLHLHTTLTDVNSAGYLAIPNHLTMTSLKEFKPAFWGGFFFTFSIGAGIALGAMAAAWIWVRMFLRKRPILFLLLFIWGGLLVMVNSNGFNLLPTLYFLLIAPVVFYLTATRESVIDIQSNGIWRLIHLVPILLLALLWSTQFDKDLFIDIRDNLLISHNIGKRFSNFYYSYTLYPTESFKALNQKTIKTSSLKNIQSRSLNQRIGSRLTNNDYLPLPDAGKVDLVIHQNNDVLVFQAGNRPMLQLPIDQFLAEPREALQKFSEACDRYTFFRQITFWSILLGFPISLYIILHAVIYYLGYFILGRKASTWMASIICLFIGVSALAYLQSNRSRSIPVQDISDALESAHWQTRIAALKIIEQKKLDLAGYPTYPPQTSDRPAQERYWLVRTLAFSRQPETLRYLLEFLNDVDLNVRTMAFYSLGLRRDQRAIKPIISKIEKSDSWYEQMYAYKSLRSLGWNQTRSR